jgi:ribonuclease H / adenosylcobalamin/alpha-ribazole phosphatase
MMFDLDPSKTCIGWLVRHGELVNMRCWDGWGNFELSDEGRQQAEAAARWLSFERIGRIVSSDVPRTMQTAQYLLDSGAVECPFMACETNLRPWNVAGFTGKEKTPERVADFKKYIENPDLVIPDGESRNQLYDRVQVIWQYLMAPYKGLPTACFIHNSVIKSLMGIDDIKDAVSPGGIIAVLMDERGDVSFKIVLGEMDPEKGVS